MRSLPIVAAVVVALSSSTSALAQTASTCQISITQDGSMTFMHCTPQEVLAYRQQMPIRDNSTQDMQPDAQARLASRMMDEQYARDARIRSQEYRQNMTGNAFSVLLSTFANRINNRGSYGGGYGRGGGYYSSGGSSGGYYPSTGGYNSSYYGYNSQHDRGRVGNGYCSDGTYRPQC